MSSARWETLTCAAAQVVDAADFERRFNENQRMVYQIAYGVLGNTGDAEDVAQDVFLRAYRKLPHLRHPDKFRAWVGRMCHRLALNHRRATGRARLRDAAWHAGRSAGGEDVEGLAAARDDQVRLRAAINALPDKLRSVVLLSAMDGLDSRAIGEVLRIPEGTVRSRLHLARRQLLRTFQP